MMVRTVDLVAELAVLTQAVAIHQRAIMAAYEAADAAEEAFTNVFGFQPHESPEHAPGWTVAKEKLEALKEENGFFWTLSRVADLETMTAANGSWKGQLPLMTAPKTTWGNARVWLLDGETPKANPAVWPWLTKTLNG